MRILAPARCLPRAYYTPVPRSSDPARRYAPLHGAPCRGLAFGRIMDHMSGCIPTGPFDVPWACAVCGKKGHLAVDDELTLAGMFDLLSQQHDHDNLFSGAVLTFHIEIEIRAETLRRAGF